MECIWTISDGDRIALAYQPGDISRYLLLGDWGPTTAWLGALEDALERAGDERPLDRVALAEWWQARVWEADDAAGIDSGIRVQVLSRSGREPEEYERWDGYA